MAGENGNGSRLREWLTGISIALALIMAALSLAGDMGEGKRALAEYDRRLTSIESSKIGERLGSIEGQLQLIVRGLGLRPGPTQ